MRSPCLRGLSSSFRCSSAAPRADKTVERLAPGLREGIRHMKQTNHRPALLPTCSLVVTTIGRGEFLADYFDAVRRERALERVDVIVIPDRKTPAALYERCAEFARKGLRVECPTIEEQDAYL